MLTTSHQRIPSAPPAHSVARKLAFLTRVGRLLHRETVFLILGPEGTWTQGGCWILAEALRRWLGDDATLRMTVCSRHDGADHAVVSVAGVYVDADGVHTERALVAKMEHREGCSGAHVVAFCEHAMRASGTYPPDRRTARLVDALEAEYARLRDARYP